MAGPETSERRQVYRELIIHPVAFCIAAAIGAIVLSRYYGIFEHDTDTPSAARDAYLTAVVITGSAGPAVSLLLLWLVRLIRRPK
jgi:hypothetical protein